LKQHVARNTQLVAGNKQLAARNMMLVARNARNLLHATSCAGVNAALRTVFPAAIWTGIMK